MKNTLLALTAIAFLLLAGCNSNKEIEELPFYTIGFDDFNLSVPLQTVSSEATIPVETTASAEDAPKSIEAILDAMVAAGEINGYTLGDDLHLACKIIDNPDAYYLQDAIWLVVDNSGKILSRRTMIKQYEQFHNFEDMASQAVYLGENVFLIGYDVYSFSTYDFDYVYFFDAETNKYFAYDVLSDDSDIFDRTYYELDMTMTINSRFENGILKTQKYVLDRPDRDTLLRIYAVEISKSRITK